jgi:hypothetical protein
MKNNDIDLKKRGLIKQNKDATQAKICESSCDKTRFHNALKKHLKKTRPKRIFFLFDCRANLVCKSSE